MLLSKAFLLLFLYVYCLQIEVCETSAESKFSSSLPANIRGNKLQIPRNLHQLQKQALAACRGKRKLCLRLFQKTNLIKSRKSDKRCCKKRLKVCKRKARRRCKSKTKCLIKTHRKCRKSHARCSRRKDANRRPGNCETRKRPRGNGRENQYRRPTTDKPIARKKEKDQCRHTSECEAGLCCARHKHIKICKPLIKVGQVCKKDFRHLNKRSPEMYERCPCEMGLTCGTSNGRHNTCQKVT